MIPFFRRLESHDKFLIMGCGGGFDVFAGVPLAEYLMAAGKTVVFANVSFANLWLCGGERVTPVTWRVDRQSSELPYFPERWLAEWYVSRGQPSPIYAFAKSGVRPLSAALRWIVDHHGIEQIVLVDGGTDSLLFGDEFELGSVVEDAVSIVAAQEAARDRTLLAAIGFGVDDYHGVSHHSVLENVAQITADGRFLGAFSVTAGTQEARAYLDLVDFANRRQPEHASIVCNSIASALRGEFGNVHATRRTSGAELFINPLMTQYWTFELSGLVDRMVYAEALVQTDRLDEARRAIEQWREGAELRLRRPIPL
ncbi:MAG: DUF1152 domain-containing protein [Pseudomonadota bacterium]|jgi:hypothetical protein